MRSPDLPPLDIHRLLRDFGLRPKKGLGQNFLIDSGALRKVVNSADIGPGDVVLEVGPGLGSLTRYLAVVAGRVIAVELDARLLPPLQQVLAPFDNVEIVHGDILQLDPTSHFPPSTAHYLVVANIPYYITSALLRHLLEAANPPRRLVLTVQQEVAQRMCAAPGKLSLLALSVQVYGAPRIAAKIPARAFFPPPKVDSAVVRVDLYPAPRIPPPHTDAFFKLAKAGFSQKRKTLRNALAGGMGWPKEQAETLLAAAEIDPQRRAETLTLPEWERLTRSLSIG